MKVPPHRATFQYTIKQYCTFHEYLSGILCFKQCVAWSWNTKPSLVKTYAFWKSANNSADAFTTAQVHASLTPSKLKIQHDDFLGNMRQTNARSSNRVCIELRTASVGVTLEAGQDKSVFEVHVARWLPVEHARQTHVLHARFVANHKLCVALHFRDAREESPGRVTSS